MNLVEKFEVLCEELQIMAADGELSREDWVKIKPALEHVRDKLAEFAATAESKSLEQFDAEWDNFIERLRAQANLQ